MANHLITVTLTVQDQPTTDPTQVVVSYDVTLNGVTNNVLAGATPSATTFTVPDGDYTLSIQNNGSSGPLGAPVTGPISAPSQPQDSFVATSFTYTSSVV